MMIQGAISKGPDAVMLRLIRRFVPLKQDQKCFLEHISGFRVAQSERPAVKNQLRGLHIVKPSAPFALSLAHADFNG